MESTGGYPQEIFLEGPSSHLMCNICLLTLKQAMQCPCGVSFCKSCTVKCISTTGTCPIGRETLTLESVSVNTVANNIVRDLDVRCLSVILSDGEADDDVSSCGWTGKLCDIEAHMSTCDWAVLCCPISKSFSIGCCSECPRKLRRKDINGHLTSPLALVVGVRKLLDDSATREKLLDETIAELARVKCDLSRILQDKAELEAQLLDTKRVLFKSLSFIAVKVNVLNGTTFFFSSFFSPFFLKL